MHDTNKYCFSTSVNYTAHTKSNTTHRMKKGWISTEHKIFILFYFS